MQFFKNLSLLHCNKIPRFIIFNAFSSFLQERKLENALMLSQVLGLCFMQSPAKIQKKKMACCLLKPFTVEFIFSLFVHIVLSHYGDLARETQIYLRTK